MMERPTRGDFLAGISVALVLVPQAMAYAEIAGLPPYVGLYAAAVAPLAASFFASSRYLQTGPVAMTSLLTFGALAGLAAPGSRRYIELAVFLALVVGVVRLALGWLRAGVVAYLMSQPVLVGFTSAAAILIVASQLPAALGVSPGDGGLLRVAGTALSSVGDWHWGVIALSALTIALIAGGQRLHRLFPGVLAAVVVGLVVSEAFTYTGALIGAIPSGLPPFSLSYPWGTLPDLLVPGIVIALVGFAEPTAIARSMAARDRERWDPNRELIAQGAANLASAFASGYPVGGSFSRSGIARVSGAKTRWAGGAAGVIVLLFVPFAGVLDTLPRAVLAGTVIAGVAPLIRIPTLVRMIGVSWGQSAVAWGTFLATIVLSPRIDLGVIVGVLLATAIHLRREIKVQVDAWSRDGRLTLSPAGVLYFGSAARLDAILVDELAAHPDTNVVVIDLEGLGRVDYTGAMALRDFTEDVSAAGLDVRVVNVPDHARGTLQRSWGDALSRVDWGE